MRSPESSTQKRKRTILLRFRGWSMLQDLQLSCSRKAASPLRCPSKRTAACTSASSTLITEKQSIDWTLTSPRYLFQLLRHGCCLLVRRSTNTALAMTLATAGIGENGTHSDGRFGKSSSRVLWRGKTSMTSVASLQGRQSRKWRRLRKVIKLEAWFP